jgi:uncharacterized protein YlzI (FlbEa/FlbD family)
MANDFKRFVAANVTVNTGASADAVYSVPAGAGSTALESIVIGISICNKNALSRTVGIFLDNYTGSSDAYIVKDLEVPGNTTVELMAGNKIVVQNSGSAGDVIRAEASNATSIDVVLSVLEDV